MAACRLCRLVVGLAGCSFALAVGSPLLGWVGGFAGLDSVFLASAASVLCAVLVAIKLLPSR